MSLYSAAILLYQVFADHQSHADSLVVYLCCPVKFSKELEETIDVLRNDPLASVNNVHFEHPFNFVKCNYHADYTASTELEGVFHQVD